MTLAEDLHGIDDCNAALARILEYFEADGGTIHLLGDDGMLELRAHSKGMPESVLELIRSVPPGKGMAGIAFAQNEVVDTCNLQRDAGTGGIRSGAKATGFGGSIAVPIRDENDNPCGTLGIATVREREFTAEEQAELVQCGKAIGCGG